MPIYERYTYPWKTDTPMYERQAHLSELWGSSQGLVYPLFCSVMEAWYQLYSLGRQNKTSPEMSIY